MNTGGTLTANNSYIGEFTGASGTAAISGTGTVWNSVALNIGAIGGSGTVNVSGGAQLTGASKAYWERAWLRQYFAHGFGHPMACEPQRFHQQ